MGNGSQMWCRFPARDPPPTFAGDPLVRTSTGIRGPIPEPASSLSARSFLSRRRLTRCFIPTPAPIDDPGLCLCPDELSFCADVTGMIRDPWRALVEPPACAFGHRKIDSLPRPTTDGADERSGVVHSDDKAALLAAGSMDPRGRLRAETR
jgi:hypothetical protein